MKNILSLEEFIRSHKFLGNWNVEYTDPTHLFKDEFLPLGEISIPFEVEDAEDSPFLPFCFKPISKEILEARISEKDNRTQQARDGVRKIFEALEECAARTGILKLDFLIKKVGDEFISTSLSNLADLGYIVIVTDTGAMKRGVISYLLARLSNTIFWTIVPVQVLYEIQDKTHKLKGLKDNRDFSKDTFKSICVHERPNATAIAKEIESIKPATPVEILNTPSSAFKISDNWKNDRFIIETAKSLRQDRSLTKEVFLATGDKTVFSLACLEELNAIYVRQAKLQEENWSFNFNIFADKNENQFTLCPIHNFIWDLTYSFSTIRLTSEDGKRYDFNYYFPEKLGMTHDVIEIIENDVATEEKMAGAATAPVETIEESSENNEELSN
jgi:hypothetical protein